MNELYRRRRRLDRLPVLRVGVMMTAAALLLSTTVASPAGAQPHAGAATDLGGSKYHAHLQEALDDLRDLGAVGAQGQVRVGRRDTVARSGVAGRRSGAPMPFDGHFRMASNTKTFVAVVLLQLVGEGRLSLDDTVEQWLPGVVAGSGNDGSRVTIRQLLQQTSGIPDYINDLPLAASAEGYYEHRFDHFDPEDLVALAMRHPPEFAAGKRWDYSNTNYILAGMVIEKVTGQLWSKQVRARILRPLGLRDTSYPHDRPTMPRPHARAYKQFNPDGPFVDVTKINPTVAGAEGGMVSTTADLDRFWRALQRGELLKPQQLTEMRKTVLAGSFQDILPGLRYGLGMFWMPNSCGGHWAHPGDMLGTTTLNAVTTSGDRAVVLYWTGALADPSAGAALQMRALRLLDDIMCE